jgi:hypothetical protein
VIVEAQVRCWATLAARATGPIGRDRTDRRGVKHALAKKERPLRREAKVRAGPPLGGSPTVAAYGYAQPNDNSQTRPTEPQSHAACMHETDIANAASWLTQR